MSPLVNPDWLVANLQNPDLVILDATMKKVKADIPEEYANIRIPAARFFDIKHVFSDTENPLPNTLSSPETFSEACRKLGINKRSKIVVYDIWGIYTSPRVWWLFKTMGHDAVFVLDGGLPGWQAVGQDCETKEKQKWDYGDFEAVYQPSLVRDIEAVTALMNQPDCLILDARSNGRFLGTEPEPRAHLRGGHIPNSNSLPFQQVLENGRYLPKEKLQEIFKAFNPEEKPMTFSCGSGITACIIYLASHIAGYDNLSVFDGSWTEWAQRLDLPAVEGE